jgi:deoxyribodipyrimidine photo-lyase
MTDLFADPHFGDGSEAGVAAAFPATVAAALARIDAIQPREYARTRNHLDGAVTRLSPYLTHGFVDVPQVIERLSQRCRLEPEDKIAFELAWREYFHHLWRHWGEGIFADRRPPPAAHYSPAMPADVLEGRTGVTVIDQAVRAPYATGYLHNHARMWLASYIVHLRKTSWKAGADWMYSHLLDGDLASNTLSWQWVAGTLTGKPYLFNAGNVERYAPEWASPGTAIDTTYEALDDIARQAPDCGPHSLRAEPVARPGMASVVDPDGWSMRAGSEECWLMHPWALGCPPQCRVIGWIEPSFHERFAWSEKRWQFVLARMREACEGIVVGDSKTLRQQLGDVRLLTRQTFNPGYMQTIASAGMLAEPVTRQFEDPQRAMPSFTRFWQAVAPKAEAARAWHR